MSEKRLFMPVSAMAMISLTSFCRSNSVCCFGFGFTGAAATGALGADGASDGGAPLELMVGTNFFCFWWPSCWSIASYALTPIASLDCMPRLPMAAIVTESRARLSTNSS